MLGIPNDGSSNWGGAAPGEIVTSGSFVHTDDEVKDLVITALDPAADHTQAP